MDRKKFIVIEGIDCSGKSTQAELLKTYFIQSNFRAIISSEPSNGIIGNLIRQTLKQRILFTADKVLFDEQMAYLFAADRHDHLYNDIDGVYKLIEDNFYVISTRYYFSSLAYNCQTPEQFDFVSKLNHKFPPPDVTIYLDIPVEISLERMKNRSLKEIYETKDKLTQVRTNYQNIFNSYSYKLSVIDGAQEPNTIHEQIINYINQ